MLKLTSLRLNYIILKYKNWKRKCFWTLQNGVYNLTFLYLKPDNRDVIMTNHFKNCLKCKIFLMTNLWVCKLYLRARDPENLSWE